MSLAESVEDGHCSSSSPPTKKRKLVGLECGLDGAQQQQAAVSQSGERNGNGTMAHNGNGVTFNGTENGSEKQIDEGLYSRQLFVLGKCPFVSKRVINVWMDRRVSSNCIVQ